MHYKYIFSVAQAGFRPKQGVENAFLRYKRAVRIGHKTLGVLDMKAAYYKLPRDKLLKTLLERLPHVLVDMISTMLPPCEV